MDNFEKNYEQAVDKAADAAVKVGGCANRAQIGCVTIFFNLLFAGFFLWGVYAAYTGFQLQTKGDTTTGTVVKLKEQSDNEGGCCTYVPVIEYQVSQQTYSFEGGTASSPPQYKVGEVVDVRYDPLDPNTAQIDSYFERWAFPICIIPAMIFASLLVNFFMIRSWRRNQPVWE